MEDCIVRPDTPRTIPVKELADNEVYLFFNDDEDGVIFQEWWVLTGWDTFKNFLMDAKRERNSL